MKKLLSLILLVSFYFADAQFTVAEKSSEWTQVGKYSGDLVLYTKDSQLKIKLKDVRSVKLSNNVLNKSRTILDDIYKEQRKSNEGIKDGYHEAIFSAEANTINDLYSLIEENFKKKSIETITLEFPEGKLYLRFYKDLFQNLLSFGIEDNGDVIYSDGYALAGVKNVLGQKKK